MIAARAGSRRKARWPPARRLHSELHFSHGLEGVGAARIVECAAFHENRTHDIVTRVRIGVQFVERIVGGTGDRFDESVARFGESRDKGPQIPQMVMRIDDRQFGFEDFFGHRRHSLPCGPLMCPIAQGFRDGTRTGGLLTSQFGPQGHALRVTIGLRGIPERNL